LHKTRRKRAAFHQPCSRKLQTMSLSRWPTGCCNPGDCALREHYRGVEQRTVLTAAGELADQTHLLRKEVERYLAQLRVAS
jgi:hypothetical protein